MRNHWIDEQSLEELQPAPRGRNPDSSVAAQYEDSMPPDTEDDAHEPS